MKTTLFSSFRPATLRQNAVWIALTVLLGASFSLRADTVTGFTLMDANSDNAIGAIISGDTIDLDVVGNEIGIRAEFTPTTIGSMGMDLSGPETINRIDNTFPYSLNGDASGDFFDWTPVAGTYTLVGTPYEFGGGTGSAGTSLTITFVVVGDGSTPPPPVGGTGEFVEIGSLVVIEAESEGVYGDWDENTSNSGFTGDSYIEWKTGNFTTSIDPAGSDPITYEILITNPGRYKLVLRSASPDPTEWNDVWARFPDNGALKEKGGTFTSIGTGWFKIYQNQSGDNWTYETKHVDFDPHNLYTDFNTPGVYRFQFSGRSTRFKVDRMVMYNESVVSSAVATDPSTPESPRSVPPVLCPVPNNPTVSIASPTTATFSWDAVTEADGYGLEGRRPGTSSWQIRLTASTSRTISALKAGFTYEWRVRSFCAAGADTSDYSSINAFTMPLVREGFSVETAAWSLFPNPASSSVRLDAVQSGWIAEAYSADGRLVQQWTLNGTNSTLSLQGLTQGLYLLRLRDAQGMPQGSQRLLIQY